MPINKDTYIILELDEQDNEGWFNTLKAFDLVSIVSLNLICKSLYRIKKGKKEFTLYKQKDNWWLVNNFSSKLKAIPLTNYKIFEILTKD